MATDITVDKGKRRFLIGATSVVGGVGAVAAAIPFVMSLRPSERAKAAGAPVEIDISKLEPGQKIDVEWRGKVCWIVSRTPEMLASLPKLTERLSDPTSTADQQPPYARQRAPLDQGARVDRGGHLHAPRLLADVPQGRRPGRPRRRLAGRLLLPLPPVEVRPRRARLQEHARAAQPRRSLRTST
jgi:hypothetical protein